MSQSEFPNRSVESQSDRDVARLIDAARDGNREAFGNLVSQYCAYLLLIANDDLGQDVQAKLGPSDIVQKTFATAHEKIHQFRGNTSVELKRWLRQILRNYILEAQRQFVVGQGRSVQHETQLTEPITQTPTNVNWTPRSCAIRNEEKELLEQAMSQLPENYQRVLRLRNWDELQFAEIGGQLGLSDEASRKLWYRALVKLRQALAAQLDASSTEVRTDRRC